MKTNSLKSKITITTVVLIIITLLATAVVSCYVIADSSGSNITYIAKSTVSDFSNQINAWLELESQKVSDIGDEIRYQKYDTDNRDGAYDYLLNKISDMPEMYAIYFGCPDDYACFSDGWIPDADYIISERQWYIDAAASETAIITEPYTDASTKKMVITIAKAVRDGNGNVTSVIAADMFIDDIQKITSEFSFTESGYPVLTTASGNVIIHKNEAFLPTVDADENEITTAFADTYSGKNSEQTDGGITSCKFTDYDGITKFAVSKTIPSSGWNLSFVMDNSELYSDVTKIVIIFCIMIPVIIVISAVVCMVIIKKCFKPLADVSTAAQQMTRGDLSVSFSYNADDEIGAVCRIIEQTNAVLKSYVDDISEHLSEMANGDFSRNITLDYVGDFAPIKTSLNNILESLNGVLSNITHATDAIFDGAENISHSANHLAESAALQTELINEIARSVDSTGKTISENVMLTENAKRISALTAEEVMQSNQHMKKLLEAMDEIRRTSDEISNINKTIEDIAFQTNILALNASVEAARAGAAGKGFAVVADEVRNLATKSSAASKQTSTLIEESTVAVENGMKFAADTADYLKNVVAQTQQVEKIVSDIAAASVEQNTYMNSINEKTAKISGYVSSSASSTQMSADASAELDTQASKLKQMMSNFKTK